MIERIQDKRSLNKATFQRGTNSADSQLGKRIPSADTTICSIVMKSLFLAVCGALFLAVLAGPIASNDKQARAPLYKAVRKSGSEYIVTLKDVSNIESVTEKIQTTGRERRQKGHVTHKLSNLLPTLVAHMSDEILEMVRDLDGVKSVEESGEITPDEFTYQWGLDRIDQANLPMDNSYTTPYTGRGVNVYVIDNGFAVKNPEFQGRASIHECSAGDGVDTYNSGHGTHVTGIIGSRSFGVAKRAALHLLQYTNTASVTIMLDCLAKMIVKPAVVSMSIGNFRLSFNDFVAEFVKSTDVNFVTSAGNTKKDACNNPPSRAKEVITVAAMSGSDFKYERTNTGPCVDLFAPGQGILSLGIRAQTAVRTGTSQACPHVSGTLALLMEREGRHIGYPEGELMLTRMAAPGKIVDCPEDTPNLLLQVPK